MQIKNKSLLIIVIIVILLTVICGCIENGNIGDSSITIKGKNGFYSTIMDAINDSSEGDTIQVGNGFYNETITIDKTISLIGENRVNTIISGNKTGDVIFVTADYVNISGFTIKNSGDEYSFGVDSGIEIKSDYNTISDNNIISNGNHGLYFTSGSKYNKIFNNIFKENRYGIYFNNAYENNIYSNNFSLNTDYGMYFGTQSNNNIISDNVFYENQYGIRIKSSDKNSLTQNSFINCKRGLYFCCGASSNIVYLNNFKNNSEWNARDGVINQWDFRNLGNYWDDYNGTDNNGDKIGDNPHIIPTADNQDNYPLMEPYEKYI